MAAILFNIVGLLVETDTNAVALAPQVASPETTVFSCVFVCFCVSDTITLFVVSILRI